MSNIEPYITHVNNYLKISGIVQPYHPLNPISSHLLDSAKKLNWQANNTKVAILSKPSNGRPSCVYCGLCVYGCLPGDKTGTNNTWLHRFTSYKNAKVLTNTEVVSVELSNNKQACAVNVISQGNQLTIPVKAVVLSAGALETPYLLRQSKQKYAPNGIGNAHVGRNLITSLMYSQLISLPQVQGSSSEGIPVDLVVNEFENRGILMYQSKNLVGITGPVSAAKFYARKYGSLGLRTWMKNNYHKLSGLSAIIESSSQYDDGINDGKTFHKNFTDQDAETLAQASALINQWRLKSKGKLLFSTDINENSMQGSMLRGTCRVGVDPKKSAVSPKNGQLHGYHNIFITDASILNKGLISDPSLTLQTLGYYFGTKISAEIT